MSNREKGYAYIMANNRPTLYTGSTNNLARRTYEHRNKLLKGFTAKYDIDNLVYYECFDTLEQALIREKQIKDMNRSDKLKMIKSFNPTFRDLYIDIINERDSGQARNIYAMKKKKWEIVTDFRIQNSKLKIDDLIDVLLKNRGISLKEKDNFLHPKLETVTPKNVGISTSQLKKALKRIREAVDKKEQIVVFGDYDVDGITGTAILWETLFALGAKVSPYIPNRMDEGYGLSKKGITNAQTTIQDIKLIITVDNGIVAHEAVTFANQLGIEVIITDHHTTSENLPDAHSIVHTTNLCGAGVAYLLSKELKSDVIASGARQSSQGIASSLSAPRNDGVTSDTHLELATLGTVADLVPLVGANRAIVAHGLEKVRTSHRPGLKALYKQAKLEKEIFGVYDIGFVIGPRLNAAGRLDSAMDSLRLLCTKDPNRAALLAEQIETTNQERQYLLKKSAEHAITGVADIGTEIQKILIVAHEEYAEGVIGLIAGKLVEQYYRPSIVIAKGETHSKASARSISGFNIIEFLRSHSEYFINVGGHPMAAGFTIETVRIPDFKKALELAAATLLDTETLTRTLRIDCVLPLSHITQKLYRAIQRLAPFGMGNPEPTFVDYGVTVENIRVMGKENNHLRLQVRKENTSLEAVAFGMGDLASDITIGDKIDLVYSIDENTWNGNTKLQLKVKDIHYKG